MREKNSLRLCPFCGGRASVHEDDDGVWIQCDTCLCGTSVIKGASTKEMNVKVATFDWNRRAYER